MAGNVASVTGGIADEHPAFTLSRRAALKGLAGAGLLLGVGVPAMSGSVAAQSSAQVSLMQSDTDSTITGLGTSGLYYDPSPAAAYDYLVNSASFTGVATAAVPSTYHDPRDSLGGSFTDAQWIWSASGEARPADEIIRIEEMFNLANMAGPFTLTYSADNFGVVFLNGAYIGGGVTWSGVTSVDVTNLLVQGPNTIEMRAWNAPHETVVSPAGAIYELMGPEQPTSIALSIDVKPGNGDEIDPINPGAKGNIPVAVYSTTDFDATTIDVSTIRFGSTAAVDAGDGASADHDGHAEDVDGDGIPDLMLHFPTQDAGFVDGDTEAKLVGQTDDGTDAVGTDDIRTVGGKGKGRGR